MRLDNAQIDPGSSENAFSLMFKYRKFCSRSMEGGEARESIVVQIEKIAELYQIPDTFRERGKLIVPEVERTEAGELADAVRNLRQLVVRQDQCIQIGSFPYLGRNIAEMSLPKIQDGIRHTYTSGIVRISRLRALSIPRDDEIRHPQQRAALVALGQVGDQRACKVGVAVCGGE